MSTLREPFAITHTKTVKGIDLTYVSWSQVADRLDDNGESWSFAVMGIGPDWAHGRLTIGDRHYENIGYAENADADWKKEPLKDAVSDAFKRCAALAGVARYLYDKDTPNSPARVNGVSSPSPRASQAPRPAAPPQSAGDAFDDAPFPGFEEAPVDRPLDKRDGFYGPSCPKHGKPWREGKFGPYCASKDEEEGNARGYCDWKPSRKWIAEHELEPAR